jgi:hypothetical protein
VLTIGVEESALLNEIRVQKAEMTADPWINPPVSLTVPMVKVAKWTLEDDPDMAGTKRTPPLPNLDALEQELRAQKSAVEIERMNFVPYGSTHLRLTVLPKVFVP